MQNPFLRKKILHLRVSLICAFSKKLGRQLELKLLLVVDYFEPVNAFYLNLQYKQVVNV